MPSVLFLGASGYIGGTFLVALKRAHPSLFITALVRSPDHIDAITSAGATPIQGDFSEHEKLVNLAEHADIVVNAADSDDVSLTEALIEGLKKRKESGKGVGVLVHISGTGVFIQPGQGKWEEGIRVWDDLSEADIKAITPAMMHGQVDAPILKSSAEGDINAYILCPSAVHGPGTGPIGCASMFFRFYLDVVLKAKAPVIVGDGTNRFEMVHIADLTSLFLLIFAHGLASISGTSVPFTGPQLTAYQKYFIGSTTATTWNAIAKSVGAALERSKSEKVKDTLHSFNVENVSADDAGPFGSFMSSNVHTRPGRGQAIGWAPNAPGLDETADGDVAAVLVLKNL